MINYTLCGTYVTLYVRPYVKLYVRLYVTYVTLYGKPYDSCVRLYVRPCVYSYETHQYGYTQILVQTQDILSGS